MEKMLSKINGLKNSNKMAESKFLKEFHIATTFFKILRLKLAIYTPLPGIPL